MSQCMRFPTIWYVRPAKPQISLRICAVWSEPLLVAWVFYDCEATDWTPFGVSKLNRRLHRLVWVYTYQNATLFEITCTSSIISMYITKCSIWEHSGLVVEYLTHDWRVAVFKPHRWLCLVFLVLVQPRKTHPDMTKNVDWDVKNQINPKIFFNKHLLECKWFGSRSGLTFCLGQTLRKANQQRTRSSLAGKMFRES